jgi:preprotein translocase subunit SecD
VAAGCGGSDDTAGCSDEGGDAITVYVATAPQGGRPSGQALDEAVRVLCERAEKRDLRVNVRRQGDDRIAMEMPDATERERRALTAPGQLAFYDWEPNVIGDPDMPLNDLDEAVRRAARAKPRAEATDVPPGDRENDVQQPPAGVAAELPRGIAIVRAQPPAEATASAPEQFFVIEDDAELTGADVRDPKQDFDQQTQEPILGMEFSQAGKEAFARVTERIAKRGQSILPQPGQSPADRFQRFAIVLDGQVVSLATVDFINNPEGISGASGAQINGIGSIEDTQALAEDLRIGPLPVRLEPLR